MVWCHSRTLVKIVCNVFPELLLIGCLHCIFQCLLWIAAFFYGNTTNLFTFWFFFRDMFIHSPTAHNSYRWKFYNSTTKSYLLPQIFCVLEKSVFDISWALSFDMVSAVSTSAAQITIAELILDSLDKTLIPIDTN